MNILINIDQTEALRRGIDAPQSTATVEIDPAELNERQREWIADHLRDGHRLPPLKLCRAAPAELIAAVDEHIAEEDRRAEEATESMNDWLQKAIDKEPDVERIVVGIDKDGQVLEGRRGVVREVIGVPKPPWVQTSRQLRVGNAVVSIEADPDLVRRYEDYVEAIRLKQESLVREAAERLQPAYQEWLAQRENDRQDYERYYERLTSTFRERYQAGYGDKDEVDEAIKDMILSDRDLAGPDWTASEKLDKLTDTEYLELKGFQEVMGDAECSVQQVWDYRQALPDDDPDEIDSDGEVACNYRTVLVAEWEEAGLDITGYRPLGE